MITWNPRVRALIRMALEEDLDTWDITSAVLPEGARGRGAFLAKAPGVVAGLPVIRAVFDEIGAAVDVQVHVADGARVGPGDVLAHAQGPTRALLTAERTILNFLQRLSGVATQTRAFVDAVAGTGAAVVDTRKTTPGWRALEKYAVTVGGGRSHRHTLSGGVLIKNNHVDALGSLAAAVARARETAPITARVEAEARTLAEVQEAVEAGADLVMLDNMSPDQMRQAVAWVAGRVPLEASGGVTLDTVAAVAATGVSYVSVGALTHSVRALDLAFHLDRPVAA